MTSSVENGASTLEAAGCIFMRHMNRYYTFEANEVCKLGLSGAIHLNVKYSNTGLLKFHVCSSSG